MKLDRRSKLSKTTKKNSFWQKKLKKSLNLFFLTLFSFLLSGFNSPVLAQLKEWEKDHTYNPSPLPNSGPGAATFSALEIIFGNLLTIIFTLAGITAFVMLLVGGFRFLTSGGDPKANQSAKGTLTWAVVGLFFLIGAWFVLRFIQEFTGADVTVFKTIIETNTIKP